MNKEDVMYADIYMQWNFFSAIKKNEILSFAAIMQLSYISLVGSVIRICLQCRRHGFNLWVWKIPWRRKWQPTPLSCLGNPMDRGAWQATVHVVAKRTEHDLATQQQQSTKLGTREKTKHQTRPCSPCSHL